MFAFIKGRSMYFIIKDVLVLFKQKLKLTESWQKIRVEWYIFESVKSVIFNIKGVVNGVIFISLKEGKCNYSVRFDI